MNCIRCRKVIRPICEESRQNFLKEVGEGETALLATLKVTERLVALSTCTIGQTGIQMAALVSDIGRVTILSEPHIFPSVKCRKQFPFDRMLQDFNERT